jgi:hypothetical protein
VDWGGGRARRARANGHERVLPEGKNRRARAWAVPDYRRRTHSVAALIRRDQRVIGKASALAHYWPIGRPTPLHRSCEFCSRGRSVDTSATGGFLPQDSRRRRSGAGPAGLVPVRPRWRDMPRGPVQFRTRRASKNTGKRASVWTGSSFESTSASNSPARAGAFQPRVRPCLGLCRAGSE